MFFYNIHPMHVQLGKNHFYTLAPVHIFTHAHVLTDFDNARNMLSNRPGVLGLAQKFRIG